MLLALSLVKQKLVDREKYRELSGKITREGLSSVTLAEARELEELHQAKKNGEFENRREEELRELVRGRMRKAQERFQEGQPPFETTFSRLKWDGRDKIYCFEGREKPIGLGGEALTWRPEFLNRISGEGESGSFPSEVSRL